MLLVVALKRAGWCLFSQRVNLSLGGLLGLLREEDSLDVGEDTALGDGHTSEQLVQLLVVTDGQLEVTGDDPGLLVVTGSVASQLEDLSSQVLHDGSHVDGGTSSHPLGVVSLAEETVDTSHGELESSTAGPGLCLSLDLASLATSRHDDVLVVNCSSKLSLSPNCGSYILSLGSMLQRFPLAGFLPIRSQADLNSGWLLRGGSAGPDSVTGRCAPSA